MQAAAPLAGWNPLFSRYFAFSTLRTLGYRTRVSVSNASDFFGPRAEPVRLRMSFHGPDGGTLAHGLDCGSLEPGRYWTIPDVDAFAAAHGVAVPTSAGELLGIVHQTPYSHEGRTEINVVDVLAWVGLGDDFVEYVHPETGATGGVFYQCPPLNDRRVGAVWVTVCQSPKVVFDDRSDPFVLLLNVSTDTEGGAAGEMDLSILDATGGRIGGAGARVPSFSARVVALRPLLELSAYKGNAMLLGISSGCALVPFTFVRDRDSKAIAIDHTMPPGNYHAGWLDKTHRAAWAADLQRRRREGGL